MFEIVGELVDRLGALAQEEEPRTPSIFASLCLAVARRDDVLLERR